MGSTELTAYTAEERGRAYRAGGISPVEVTEATLELIESLNPVVNAFITVTPDHVRAPALKAERDFAHGRSVGALAGVPLSVKDTAAPIAGIPLTNGTRLHADLVPDVTSRTAQRTLDAGAVLVGKTNCSKLGWKGESGNQFVGLTLNPYALARTAGGSSGGAAAAVATGMGPLAHGTDGAGSIRIPSSFCGVVGMKPSHGLLPMHPANALRNLMTERPWSPKPVVPLER